MANLICIQTAPFDFAQLQGALQDRHTGAIVCFTGKVRSSEDNPVTGMTLEHYPGMTEQALNNIAEQACQRWSLQDTQIIHRTGYLKAGEDIVYVAAASSHRLAAFEACSFMMDYLKTQAPFWKKEHRPDGDHWVEHRLSDQQAEQRWHED